MGSIFGFRVELSSDIPDEDRNLDAPRGLHVLVMEENATTRDAIESMLSGNRVEALSSGLAARRTLLESAHDPFDLVVLDVRHATEFGLGAGEMIPFPPVPLVLLTPVSQLGKEGEFAWSGRCSSVARPVKARDLLWCIADVLGQQIPLEVGQSFTSRGGRNDLYLVGHDNEPVPGHSLVGLRVLVAEDHPVNQRITTRFLEKLGMEWELAENGEIAFELFRASRFDVVLMDVQMPVIDGLEATRIIRTYETTAGGLVVAVAVLPFYNWFTTRIGAFVNEIETATNFLFETLDEMGQKAR